MVQLFPTTAALLALALFVPPAAGLPQVGSGSSTPTPPRAPAPAGLLVDLDVDADRDGVVEVSGAEDDAGEHLWSTAKGAVFLFNNDDDDGDGAADATDSVVNGAADALDLAPVRLRPIRGVPSAWTGALGVNGEAAPWVRLFREQGGSWTLFDPTSTVVTAAELRQGLELGIEALDYAQTSTGAAGKWGGEVVLTFVLRDGAGLLVGSDVVRLRVAPFLLHSNLDAAETVYVTRKTYTQPFIAELAGPVAAAGAVLHEIDGISMEPSYGIWDQDAMEFGYSAMPAIGGRRCLPAVLRAPRGRALDAWTWKYCLGPDFGYVYKGWYRSGVDWIDWFGNLDCTPPLPGWPLGRIYTGYQGSLTIHPEVLSFLDAQAVQGPVLSIDTGWLVIGHVDEEICFVPANTGSPYRMLIPDTQGALAILQDLQNQGKGGLTVFAGTSDQTTVNGLLGWTQFVNYNQNLQATIDAVRQQMKTGCGIAEQDIIDVPSLFWKYGGTNQALAHMPNMVNSLIAGTRVIAADPFGPVDGSVDKFKEPFVQEMNAIGLQVDFVDDWYPYHEWWGEVHCGTNATRTPAAGDWWAVP